MALPVRRRPVEPPLVVWPSWTGRAVLMAVWCFIWAGTVAMVYVTSRIWFG